VIYGGVNLSLIQYKNISFADKGNSILKNININIEKGDYISIVGPSGSGKSTFLKLTASLISPTEGSIYFYNKPYNDINPIELRRRISYCFQTPYLFGSNVMDNLCFPFSIRNLKTDMHKIDALLKRFKLNSEFKSKDVLNLSGGEKQRIALIRSLLFSPQVLLLDEVTSALDSENTLIVEELIKELNEEGTTILWVTHNMEQSRKNANKRLTIKDGSIKSLEVIE
jgi:putative ABC transport system ATP-binding protein